MQFTLADVKIQLADFAIENALLRREVERLKNLTDEQAKTIEMLGRQLPVAAENQP